jgi:hypothetical protein
VRDNWCSAQYAIDGTGSRPLHVRECVCGLDPRGLLLSILQVLFLLFLLGAGILGTCCSRTGRRWACQQPRTERRKEKRLHVHMRMNTRVDQIPVNQSVNRSRTPRRGKEFRSLSRSHRSLRCQGRERMVWCGVVWVWVPPKRDARRGPGL